MNTVRTRWRPHNHFEADLSRVRHPDVLTRSDGALDIGVWLPFNLTYVHLINGIALARTTGSIGIETAERIRSEAEKLFAARGFAAVSMREIAGAVGVQAAALYNHFSNKQALLEDLLVSHMECLIAAWKAESDAQDSAGEALERFARFHIRYHIDRSDAVFISYMELRNLEPENFRRVENLRKTYEAFVVDILEGGQASGEFDLADTRITAMAIIAMLTGVNTWYRSRGRLSLAEIEGIYTKMVLRSAGAQLKEASCLAAE